MIRKSILRNLSLLKPTLESRLQTRFFNTNKKPQRATPYQLKMSPVGNYSTISNRGYVEPLHLSKVKDKELPIKELDDTLFLTGRTEASSGRLIKAAFSKCAEGDKLQFHTSNCLITLSIGQPVHSGSYIAATLESVNHSFKSCTFVLGDTLQRFTLALTTPGDERKLYTIAKQHGDQWLKDNIPLLTKLTIPWKITRWDYWLENKKFKKILSTIQNEYESEQNFRKIFDDNIQEYLDRLKNRGALKIDEEQAKKICLQYLQEECAVMWLWVEENCQYELYANGRTPAMQATYDRFIGPMHPDLLRPISMRFKRIGNYRNNIMESEKELTSEYASHPI